MINTTFLDQSTPIFDEQFLAPSYGQYSFSALHQTIISLFTGQHLDQALPAEAFKNGFPKPSQVVVFFVDAMGWRFWQKFQEHFGEKLEGVNRVLDEGVITPISALFPSTTSASVTNFNFGILPSQHALYEWNLYIPQYQDIIQTLLFSPLGAKERDLCLAKGYDPNQLFFAGQTLWQKLAGYGVQSHLFTDQKFVSSAYSKLTGVGGEVQPYLHIEQAMSELKALLTSSEGRHCHYLYYGEVDAAGHKYGPDSHEIWAEIERFWRAFNYNFSTYQKTDDILFLFTADHGMANVYPETTIYLNQLIPEITDWLATTPTGQIIYPNGSPRDVFLHIKPEYLNAAFERLQTALTGRAIVIPTSQAIDQGLFGSQPPTPEFLARLGQILILSLKDQSIWWNEPGILEMNKKGHHGGLSREEMLTVAVTY